MDRADLKLLTTLRVREARALLNAGHAAGAYYLAGYAVECALKACIARQTKRHEFPNKERALDSYKHDLSGLVKTAGLKTTLDRDGKANHPLSLSWTVVKDWDVESRYDPKIDLRKAQDLYRAVAGRAGVLRWVRRHW